MLPQSKPAEVPPELADMELAAQRARPLHNPMREHSSECESTLHRTVPQPLPI